MYMFFCIIIIIYYISCSNSSIQGVIASVVSKEQLEHYVELTVKQFADNSADIRWCPYPDCGYAICIKKEDKAAGGEAEKTADGATALPFQPGWNVECGRGHGFCWYVCIYIVV